jgi:hypothetical protein
MSAATLTIRWDDCDRDQAVPVVPGGRNVFSNIAVDPRQLHCPSCGSIVYTRRHRLCGVCDQARDANKAGATRGERIKGEGT